MRKLFDRISVDTEKYRRTHYFPRTVFTHCTYFETSFSFQTTRLPGILFIYFLLTAYFEENIYCIQPNVTFGKVGVFGEESTLQRQWRGLMSFPGIWRCLEILFLDTPTATSIVFLLRLSSSHKPTTETMPPTSPWPLRYSKTDLVWT